MFRSFGAAIDAALLLVVLAACSNPPSAPSSSTIPAAEGSPTVSPTAARTSAPANSVTPTPIPSFAQLSAPSSNVVWALLDGTRLFRSTDSGDNWEERYEWLGACCPFREVAFINDHEGWLATPSVPGTQCQFQSVGIAHTTDAGRTWDQFFVAAPPSAGDPGGLANGQCKSGLVFTDQLHGFMSASDLNFAPVIHRTTDGGRTWSRSRPLPDPPGFTTRGAGVALHAGRVHANGTTLLVDASGSVDGQRVRYAFRSVDGGASWSYVATLPRPDGTFVFVSLSRWLQISLPGSSKETTDGGATWHSFTSDYSQAAGVAPQIVFGDALVGYATVRGGIQRTVDGGAHWTFLKGPGT